MPISHQDITSTIVGIGVGGVPRCAEQLALVVVGVAILLPDFKCIIPSCIDSSRVFWRITKIDVSSGRLRLSPGAPKKRTKNTGHFVQRVNLQETFWNCDNER